MGSGKGNNKRVNNKHVSVNNELNEISALELINLLHDYSSVPDIPYNIKEYYEAQGLPDSQSYARYYLGDRRGKYNNEEINYLLTEIIHDIGRAEVLKDKYHDDTSLLGSINKKLSKKLEYCNVKYEEIKNEEDTLPSAKFSIYDENNVLIISLRSQLHWQKDPSLFTDGKIFNTQFKNKTINPISLLLDVIYFGTPSMYNE